MLLLTRTYWKCYLVFVCLFSTNLISCTSHPIKSIDDHRFTASKKQAKYVHVPFNQQTTDYGCGIAVLTSLIEYWGEDIDQSQLLKSYPPKSVKTGYSIGELKTIAHKKSLAAFTVQGDIDTLKAQILKGRPIIIPLMLDYDYITNGITKFMSPASRYLLRLFEISYRHYAVVIGFDDENLWVLDPVLGIKTVRSSKLLKMWSEMRYALLLIAQPSIHPS